ncbi:MAG: hypothetical protein WC554_01055 [Clostridia bacterium]|jgi:hypothetical protein
MSYELELKADERAVEQERRLPVDTHGDFITEDDIREWHRAKRKYTIPAWLNWLIGGKK